MVNGFLVGFRRAIAFHDPRADRRVGQGVNLAGLDHLLETSIEQLFERNRGRGEKPRQPPLNCTL